MSDVSSYFSRANIENKITWTLKTLNWSVIYMYILQVLQYLYDFLFQYMLNLFNKAYYVNKIKFHTGTSFSIYSYIELYYVLSYMNVLLSKWYNNFLDNP